MADLILTLLGLGYTVTFERCESGDHFCLLRRVDNMRLVHTAIADTPEEAVLAVATWVHGQAGSAALNPPAQQVKLTVTGECDHVIWTGFDKIEEKYPFWCEQCDDFRANGRYPWKLASEIVQAAA